MDQIKLLDGRIRQILDIFIVVIRVFDLLLAVGILRDFVQKCFNNNLPTLDLKSLRPAD